MEIDAVAAWEGLLLGFAAALSGWPPYALGPAPLSNHSAWDIRKAIGGFRALISGSSRRERYLIISGSPNVEHSMVLSRLFRRRKLSEGSSLVPPGERIYAIGDVHGRVDLLDRLLEQVVRDSRDADADIIRLVFLGDLIDRGPSSRAVIDRVMQTQLEYSAFHWLTGNHEEMLLAALNGNVAALRQFIRAGGNACLLSYGLDPLQYQQATIEQLSLVLPGLIPPSHRQFLGSGEDLVIRGDYVFVHAGIRPGTPLERQRLQDLRWIRHDFSSATHFDGLTIVHGHTITTAPVNLRHRIGIDTGAFRTGKLSAVALEGNRRWFLQSEAPG